MDRASNKCGARISIVLENSFGVIIKKLMRLEKNLTNNEAKSEALIYGLELALKLGV